MLIGEKCINILYLSISGSTFELQKIVFLSLAINYTNILL